MRPLMALALLAGIAVAAPVPKAVKKRDDKTALLGAWFVTDLTVNGKNNPVSYSTFTFDDEGKVTLRHQKGENGGSSWTWTIDPEATPAGMKWGSQQGRNEWDLVYQLDGETLKLGFIAKGSKPPEKVEPGEGLTLYVLKRDTSSK